MNVMWRGQVVSGHVLFTTPPSAANKTCLGWGKNTFNKIQEKDEEVEEEERDREIKITE